MLSDIDILCNEGQQLTALKLLNSIKTSLSPFVSRENPVINVINSVITSRCLPSLINVVVSAKYIDTQFLFNLLLGCGKDYMKYIQYYLKMYRRQPQKLHTLSVLGIKLLDFYQEEQCREVMQNAILTCKWWEKLKLPHDKMKYETFFKSFADVRLTQLISLDVVDATMIEKYCSDFSIIPDSYFKEYLKR